MSAVISCHELSKTFLDTPLFEGVTLILSAGDRIGIIGANGSGKTTLLKIFAGLENIDCGEMIVRKGLRVGYVPQDSRFDPDLTVEQVVFNVSKEVFHASTDNDVVNRVRTGEVLGRLGFEDPGQKVGVCSGGWKKRLALACALVAAPDVLLLDEPTNHLDIEGILWLENFLLASRFAYIVVSHDRVFLQKCATRIMELDRRYPGGLLSFEGDYTTFLEKREFHLIARARQQVSLSTKVHTEIEWLRSGVKARATKARTRIDEAHRLIDELETMKKLGATGKTRIDFSATGRKSKRLLYADSIGKSMGERNLFSNLSLLLRPKMRLGLVGANGSGKTTLLKILAGELRPDEGEMIPADNLRVVYFAQQREQLDPDLSLRCALAEKGDTVIFRDRALHVAGWAARFGFQSKQLDMPVGRMSGGERAKILIARLMLQPADILLLDEPTNDLDIPTLEVLEESLMVFPGALVLVTHDRYMLDRISDVLLGLSGRDQPEYFADHSQWEAAQCQRKPLESRRKKTSAPRARAKSSPTKLSYKEQLEYDGLEATIREAEAEVEKTQQEMVDPDVASDAERLRQYLHALESAQAILDALYTRWYELESKLEAMQVTSDKY